MNSIDRVINECLSVHLALSPRPDRLHRRWVPLLYRTPEAQQLLLLLLLEHMREAQHLLLPVLGLVWLHMPRDVHCSGLQLTLELAQEHCPYRCWAPQ